MKLEGAVVLLSYLETHRPLMLKLHGTFVLHCMHVDAVFLEISWGILYDELFCSIASQHVNWSVVISLVLLFVVLVPFLVCVMQISSPDRPPWLVQFTLLILTFQTITRMQCLVQLSFATFVKW